MVGKFDGHDKVKHPGAQIVFRRRWESVTEVAEVCALNTLSIVASRVTCHSTSTKEGNGDASPGHV